MKGRCWTDEEDQLLAETVLQAVREGGNQLDAFEKVSRKIGRTPGACGFRWNAVVRKREAEAFQMAKKQRVVSQLKRKQEPPFSLKDVVRYLKTFEDEYRKSREHLHRLEVDRKAKERALRDIAQENRRLKEEWEAFQNFQTEIKDRYSTLVKMLETARSMKEEMPEGEEFGTEKVDYEKSGTAVDTKQETNS
ncbi:RsfA family transcriptional regulator [Salinithrix halophila]|uniref:RsfA family transcriptional regulator n=1 Tax=Salinithrix halophila TaxID=1485204 RepID=A0ABV8JFA8_9BACL